MKQLSGVLLIIISFQVQLFSQTNTSQLATSIRPDGNAPDASAILDVNSPNQGMLVPRMDYADILAIPSPALGLMVYDTEFLCLRIFNGTDWDCLYQATGAGGSSLTISANGYGTSGSQNAYDIKTDIVGKHYICGNPIDNIYFFFPLS